MTHVGSKTKFESLQALGKKKTRCTDTDIPNKEMHQVCNYLPCKEKCLKDNATMSVNLGTSPLIKYNPLNKLEINYQQLVSPRYKNVAICNNMIMIMICVCVCVCDIWYDMIWYMIWYDIWYDMIWYDMIWYDMIYDMIWYDMIWYNIIWIEFSIYNLFAYSNIT